MIFVMKFQAAAMSRANIPEDDRVDFSLYVDEFQNFSTDSFADILSEARKYRLKLIIANQFTTQLTDEIRDAVFGNVGTIIAFRVGTADADFLSKQFSPVFTHDDLQRIPNYNAIVRMLIGGVPTQPFSMAGLPPLGNPSKELAAALKQLSAAKHGRPRAAVEKIIFERMQTTEPAPAAAGAGKPVAGRMGAGATGAAPAPPRQQRKPASFLDDWTDKKKTNSFKAPKSPFNKQPRGPQQPLPAQSQYSQQQPLPPQPQPTGVYPAAAAQQYQAEGYAYQQAPQQQYPPAPTHRMNTPQPHSQYAQQYSQQYPAAPAYAGMAQPHASHIQQQPPGPADAGFAYDRDANPAFAPNNGPDHYPVNGV